MRSHARALLGVALTVFMAGCTPRVAASGEGDAGHRFVASYASVPPVGALLGALPAGPLGEASSIAQLVGSALAASDGAATAGTGVIQVPPPTGVPDIDTANINAAISALPATGGVVQLQAGTYVVAAPNDPSLGVVTMSVNNGTLAGMGIGATTIQLAPNSPDTTGIIRTADNVPISHVTFRDFTIDGNRANQSATARIIGFFCGTSPDTTPTATDIALLHMESMNNTWYGFDPHQNTTRIFFIGCVSHDNGTDGFTLDGNYEGAVIGCVAYNNTRHGYNIVTGSNHMRLIGDEAYGNGGAGAFMQQGAKNDLIEGCIFHDNALDGIIAEGVPNLPPHIDLTSGTNNAVVGNLIESSGKNGIHVIAESGAAFVANVIVNSGQRQSGAYSQICMDEEPGGDGGTVYSTQNVVYANSMTVTNDDAGAPEYGIYEISANEDGNMYVGNQSFGASSAQWHLQGPASIAYAAHNGSTGALPSEYAYASDAPPRHGLMEWDFPPGDINGAPRAITSGTVYFAAFAVQNTFTVGHVDVFVETPGSGLTAGESLVGLYTVSTSTGAATLASGSADQSANWSDVGDAGVLSSVALTTPTAVTAGQVVLVAILSVGATPPALARAPYSSGGPSDVGQALGTPLNFSTYDNASSTTLPASPVTLLTDTTSAGTIPIWVGLGI